MLDANTVVNLLDTDDKFKDWLEKRPVEELVGVAGDSTACPVANFLSGHVQDPGLHVDAMFITGLLFREYAPDWVTAFVREVDKPLSSGPTVGHKYAVSAGEALACLERSKNGTD